jgi:hypothetical protein
VQIGVTETGFKATKTADTRPPLFEAFWSDTQVGFHPVNIARVETGDRISLEMRLQSSGWNLRVQDLTSGSVHHVVTDYGAAQNFNATSWIQEDPTSGANPLVNLPYPDMSQTAFSHVEANGMTPAIGLVDAQVMNVPGGPCLVPTAFVDGGFRVVGATGFARQYLSDIAWYNYAEGEFAYALQHSPPGQDRRIISESVVLVRALDESEQDFAAQTWPADVSTAVQSLLSDDYLLSEQLRYIGYGGFSAPRLLSVLQDQDTTVGLSREIRADLGLPPPGP